MTNRSQHPRDASFGGRVLGGAIALVFAGAAWSQEQKPPETDTLLADPFFKDAKAGYHFRTFFMNKDNPNGSANEAWAAGGWLYGRTGYWRDFLQLGATYYFSLPIYAPEDKDGTQLLRPGQDPIYVLGELYARLRYEKQTLTLYRQEIDMNYPRPSGVRSNRSDLTYLGRLDNRMVPVTYEAALLGGPIPLAAPGIEALRYWVGYSWDAKPRDSNDFISMGEAIGAKSSDAGMSIVGLQWSPMKDFWTQAWYWRSSDVLQIVYLDLDYVNRLSKESYFRLATQYTNQNSAGGTDLTGQTFSTWNWEAYGEFGWQWLTLYGAYSTIGDGENIRTPFSSGPIYTQQLTRSFTRAGEDTWQLGVGVNLDQFVRGLSFWVDYTDGRNAVNPKTKAALPNETEVDVGMIWTYREKGSIFDGFRARARYGWVADDTPTGTQRGTDFRVDINWPIPFF
jgi:hypothetical protein